MFFCNFYAHLLASLLLFRSLIQVAASSIHHDITIVPSIYIIPMPPKKKQPVCITRAGGERANGPTGQGTSAEPQLGESSAQTTRGSSTMPTQMKVVTMPARKGKGSKGGGKYSSKKSNVMSNLKTPPEMLIAADAPLVGTAVDLSATTMTKGVMELDSPSAGTVARVPAAAKSRSRSEHDDKSVRKVALAELLKFQKMYKDAQRVSERYMSIASSSEEDPDDDFKCLPDYPYDPGMFDSEEDELDDPTYYRDTSERGKGAVGRKLVTGGPVKPNTDGLSEVEAEKLIMKWRKDRKKYTDHLALMKRKVQSKEDVQAYDTSDEFTGVLVEKIRLQTQVEETPMMVGHTYPTKEIVLLRIAEEANVSGCMISFVRSDSKRVYATGGRDGHKFCINVMYNNAHSWKVEVCHTYPEKLVDEKLVDDDNNVETNAAEVGGEVGNPDDHSEDDLNDDDNGDSVDDDDGNDNESDDEINAGE